MLHSPFRAARFVLAFALLSLPLADARAQDAAPAAAAPAGSASPAGPALSSSAPTIDLGDSFGSVSPSHILYDPGAVGTDYVLGPGDAVSVTVSPQAKYSQTQLPVTQTGMIDYPVIGKIQASGRTMDAVAADIKQRLQDYCVNPDVSITLTNERPEVVFVTGGVNGQRALDAHAASTLAKAIMLSGGAWDRNQLTHVAVLRGKQVLTANMYPLLVQGIDNGQNIALEPGDTVVVPISTAKVTVLGATNSQGVYALDDLTNSPERPARLSDALSRAGGTRGGHGARIGQIAIMREASASTTPQITKYDYGKFLKSGDLTQDPVLQDGDMIIVPEENHPINQGSIMSFVPFYYFFRGL